MTQTQIGIVLLSVLSCTLLTIFFSKAAAKLKLIDNPNERKKHARPVPLVGGISIFISLVLVTILADIQWPFDHTILILASILFITGILDDVIDLPASLRLILFFAVAVLAVYWGDVKLVHFGKIFGDWTTDLGVTGEILTIVAIVAGMNAFNMIDGMDGLLAVFIINVFFFLLLLGSKFDFLYIVLLSHMLVFFIANMGVKKNGNKKQIFMGDSGSITFGFLIVCILISQSQNETAEIRPVSALWLIAIPLMDFVAIVLRRLRKGQSIMKADRQHLHHIFMRFGYSHKKILFVVAVASTICSLLGILGEKLYVAESVMFFMFILMFLGYLYFIFNCWRLTRYFRSAKQ